MDYEYYFWQLLWDFDPFQEIHEKLYYCWLPCIILNVTYGKMPQLSIAFLTFEHAVYLKRPFVPIVEENPQGDFLFECIHNTSLQFFGIINIAMRSISVYLANVGIVLQHILFILYRYWSISNAESEIFKCKSLKKV